MLDAYLTHLADVRRMSANTIESYARDLGALAAFASQRRTDVESLTRKDLEAFVRDLMVSGLAPRSVARSVAGIRGFYRFVAVERKQDRTPADDLRPPRAWPAPPPRREPGRRCRNSCLSSRSINSWRSPIRRRRGG